MKFIRLLIFTLGLIISLKTHSNTLPTQLTCGGTEPFWSASIRNNKVLFNLTGQNRLLEYLVEGSRPTANNGLIMWVELKDLHGGHVAHLVLSDTREPGLSAGHCNDGMSDRTYPYSIVFKTPHSLYSGCCE